MSTFVDTSAMLAVLDAGEVQHRRAHETWQNLLARDEPLISTNYVFVETHALVQRRLGMEAVGVFLRDIAPVLNLRFVDEATHEAAVAACTAANRRGLSLVDCVSFEAMRRSGLRDVFCFDPHFGEAGFHVLP